MPQNILNFINQISPLSAEAQELIQPLFRFKSVKKNTILCAVKDTPRDFYFINSGIVRAFIETPKGATFNKSIFIENQFAGPMSALILNKPSRVTYEALTDCELIMVDYNELMKLCHKNHDLLKLSYRLLEIYFVSLENRTLNLGTLNAKERYLGLKNKIKYLENRIPQYHIASLLGITPIQLSRIRKDLLKNN